MNFALCMNDDCVHVDICNYEFLHANATAFLNIDGLSCGFSYLDSEGDIVSIKKQVDVEAAIAFMKQEGISSLRINVTPLPAPSAKINETIPAPTQQLKEEKVSTVFHTRRVCDGCGICPIQGTRFRSKANKTFDFCSNCAMKPIHQAHAPFDVIEKELQTHDNVQCDGCNMSPLEGIRYKSTTVKDFDLCSDCEATGKWASHEPFVMIKNPKKNLVPDNVHENIICDGCNAQPIVGARFKSALVKNFDLCDSCERLGKWNMTHGPFLKIYTRQQAPVALYVATNQEENVQTPEEFSGQHPHHHHHHHPHHHHPHHPHHPHHHHPHHPHHHHPHHHHHHPHHPGSKGSPETWKGKREHWRHEQKSNWKQQKQEQKAQWKQHVHDQKANWKHAKAQWKAGDNTQHPCDINEVLDELKVKMKECFRPEHVAKVRDAMASTFPVELFDEFKARSEEWLEALASTDKYEAKYIGDVNIPEGTVCFPGEVLKKQWRIENNGQVAWPNDTQVKFAGGVSMSDESAVISVPSIAPGSSCVIEMTLKAPEATGRHASYFCLSSPSGNRFGNEFWISIVVDEEMAKVADTNLVDNIQVDVPLANLIVEDNEEQQVTAVGAVSDELKAVDTVPAQAEEISACTKEINTTTEGDEVESANDDYVEVSSASDGENAESDAAEMIENETEFVAELNMLRAMGFENDKQLQELLIQFDGNMEKVLGELLE